MTQASSSGFHLSLCSCHPRPIFLQVYAASVISSMSPEIELHWQVIVQSDKHITGTFVFGLVCSAFIWGLACNRCTSIDSHFQFERPCPFQDLTICMDFAIPEDSAFTDDSIHLFVHPESAAYCQGPAIHIGYQASAQAENVKFYQMLLPAREPDFHACIS